LIPNPIVKVLSTLSCHAVRHLLMGGQACVFYGAAEFSRDCDIVILAEPANFQRFQAALDELHASRIAVPPFDPQLLERGHAVHFRCAHPEASGMRLDVMTRMRGVDPFEALWERRTTVVDNAGVQFELLGIQDLVAAKKTQRDKDWPMIRRLIESHYATNRNEATDARIEFWLLESRTPEMLIQLAADFNAQARSLVPKRKLLSEAFAASRGALEKELRAEELLEKEADRTYWQSLKRELEQLRFRARRESTDRQS
jgi:hypothetical protein